MSTQANPRELKVKFASMYHPKAQRNVEGTFIKLKADDTSKLVLVHHGPIELPKRLSQSLVEQITALLEKAGEDVSVKSTPEEIGEMELVRSNPQDKSKPDGKWFFNYEVPRKETVAEGTLVLEAF